MSKQPIANIVAGKADVSLTQAEDILNAFYQTVQETLKSGENIYLKEIGSFVLYKHIELIARNLKTNEAIPIPSKAHVAFQPSKALFDFLNA